MSPALSTAAAAALVLLACRGGSVPGRSRAVPAAGAAPDDAALRRLRVPLVGLAILGGWTLVGGWFGAVVGAAAGLFCWRVLNHAESPATHRRREQLESDLPIAVQLLGAALAAGAAPTGAVLVVADAVGGPIADELRRTHHRLVLGVDPVTVWRSLDGPLRPLGRTMVRAYESGGSIQAAVENCADDLRAASRVRVEALARSVEVRAAAPLGICFLPAFVVLGVVPMAVGIFSSLHLFG